MGTASNIFIRAINVTLLSVIASFLAYLPTNVHPSVSLADIYEAKHARKCAIPTGNYTISVNQISPRFGKLAPYSDFGGIVPRYEGVKGFAGVLMHVGNFPKDTDGCTLVGRYAKKDAITDSKVTFVALMKMLLAVPKMERIYISVERSYK